MSKGITKISVEIEETKTSWEVPYTDCSLSDLFDAFKGLLITHTFNPEIIDKYILECADTIKETNNINNKEYED